MKMKNHQSVLIIGAGHIGAMSDINTAQVNTYAKFFSKFKNFNICVLEPDEAKASLVASKYGYRILSHYDVKLLSDYTLVVIASPSDLHHKQLIDCVSVGVPTVICGGSLYVDFTQLQDLQSKLKKPIEQNILSIILEPFYLNFCN